MRKEKRSEEAKIDILLLIAVCLFFLGFIFWVCYLCSTQGTTTDYTTGITKTAREYYLGGNGIYAKGMLFAESIFTKIPWWMIILAIVAVAEWFFLSKKMFDNEQVTGYWNSFFTKSISLLVALLAVITIPLGIYSLAWIATAIVLLLIFLMKGFTYAILAVAGYFGYVALNHWLVKGRK